MSAECLFTINHALTGELSFKLFSFKDNRHFDHIQRNNYYSILWIQEGDGCCKIDFSEYSIHSNCLLACAPYQPFMLSGSTRLRGIAIQFHPDFYCIHKNPRETNCDHVLFNNIYSKPIVHLDAVAEHNLKIWLSQLMGELEQSSDLELIVPILKILLVMASRLKSKQMETDRNFISHQTPYLIDKLKREIETHYKTRHLANEYAVLLNISPATLAKLVKSHLNKTLTELITERIMLEAKRELYMTHKSIKEIAWCLGYSDEYHFSRLFKNNSGVSPMVYRQTVGFGKAEMN